MGKSQTKKIKIQESNQNQAKIQNTTKTKQALHNITKLIKVKTLTNYVEAEKFKDVLYIH